MFNPYTIGFSLGTSIIGSLIKYAVLGVVLFMIGQEYGLI